MRTATRSSVARSAVAVVTVLAMVLAVVVAIRSGVEADAGGDGELAELLAAGEGRVGVATYEVQLDSLPGALVTLQVFRSSSDVRHDLVVDTAGTVTRVAAITSEEGHRRCTFESGGDWECAPATAGTSEPELLLGAFRTAVASGAAEAVDREVAGRDATCFSSLDGADATELCLAPDGLLLRASSPDASVELVEATDRVDPRVFEDPATTGR